METGKRWLRGVWMVALLLVSTLPAAAWAEEGDPVRGEALYVGTAAFEKGAAPCLGCHGIAGAGLGKAAGASYGPDLTETWESFGEEMIDELLQSMPFPSMEAIYAERPLSGDERRNLAAFLREVSGRETPRIAGSLLVEAGAGIGVFFLVIAIFSRGRLKSERPCPCANLAKK